MSWRFESNFDLISGSRRGFIPNFVLVASRKFHKDHHHFCLLHRLHGPDSGTAPYDLQVRPPQHLNRMSSNPSKRKIEVVDLTHSSDVEENLESYRKSQTRKLSRADATASTASQKSHPVYHSSSTKPINRRRSKPIQAKAKRSKPPYATPPSSS
jgi:hypothetical protein